MNQVAVFQPPRLPFHDQIEQRFGVDRSGWKALVEAVFPSAKSVDSVIMALSYCRARKLDPFKKPVHIVPMWDSKSGGYIETIWPGIAELRTTAFRTGNYAGCDEAEFGDEIEQTFTGRVKVKGNWEDKSVRVRFPSWCRMTVHRVLGGRVCKFVGPKVYWLESYATIGNSDIPNDMWQGRPTGQIEKCAEAAALRKAFPEELGNELTAEEMEGRTVHAEAANIAPAATPAPPSPPSPTLTDAPPPSVTEYEAQDAPVEEVNASEFFENLEIAMAGASTVEDVEEVWNEFDVGGIFDGDDDSLSIAQKIKDRRLRDIQ
ncbi:phage recombination protein Bet [Aureimonas altamirensis]|uniref:phage recombination protein Bet n=1 Tax=Aureimonas altamirensis TaxID=370622 RepID=UPI0006916FC5|nr:phage recombination protein Bet [Aureimonas altamirensis]